MKRQWVRWSRESSRSDSAIQSLSASLTPPAKYTGTRWNGTSRFRNFRRLARKAPSISCVPRLYCMYVDVPPLFLRFSGGFSAHHIFQRSFHEVGRGENHWNMFSTKIETSTGNSPWNPLFHLSPWMWKVLSRRYVVWICYPASNYPYFPTGLSSLADPDLCERHFAHIPSWKADVHHTTWPLSFLVSQKIIKTLAAYNVLKNWKECRKA